MHIAHNHFLPPHTYAHTQTHTHACAHTNLEAQRCTGIFQVDQNLLMVVAFLDSEIQQVTQTGLVSQSSMQHP